jgi:ubiquinol-cytochrome c reductase subunit 8
MGKGFGNLGVRVRHIITFSLSPYEQRAFAGMFSKSPGNLLRRISDNVIFVAPGFICAGLIYYFGTKDHDRRLKKNPEDYINDE